MEVGSGSAVDNGAMNDTVIGRGTKVDNLVHLGHNVEIGEDCFIIAQVGIAGSTKIGDSCVLAGQTGITGHVNITDHVVSGSAARRMGAGTNHGDSSSRVDEKDAPFGKAAH